MSRREWFVTASALLMLAVMERVTAWWPPV